jgi:N-acetylglucosaminyl-diphospho-decaprenol L-rhamnosyltransferase
MSPRALDSVSVVTVTYNSSSALEPFLTSIEESEPTRVDAVVVDNNSSDLAETKAIVDAHGSRLLSLPDNRGYGGAINAAVRTLPESIEFVLISNPDVMLHPGAISTLVDFLQSDRTIAAVGPRVLNEDGTTYPSARRLPSLRTGVGHALFADLWPGNPWSRSYRADEEGTDVVRTVGWLSGSCLLVRRSAFDSIGGFDEGFFMYFEDVDLGYRLGKAGWKCVYQPSAVVVHTGAHSTTTESARMLQTHHDSAYRYLTKKYSAPYLAPLRWSLRVGLSVRARYLTRATARANRRRTSHTHS